MGSRRVLGASGGPSERPLVLGIDLWLIRGSILEAFLRAHLGFKKKNRFWVIPGTTKKNKTLLNGFWHWFLIDCWSILDRFQKCYWMVSWGRQFNLIKNAKLQFTNVFQFLKNKEEWQSLPSSTKARLNPEVLTVIVFETILAPFGVHFGSHFGSQILHKACWKEHCTLLDFRVVPQKMCKGGRVVLGWVSWLFCTL